MCHNLKLQTIVTPYGIIDCMWGPMNGNIHDSHMLRESELLKYLRNMIPLNGHAFTIYRSPVYPQWKHVFGGFHNPAAGSPEAEWNTRMSRIREVVKWGCKEIVNQWRYLDFRASMKVFEVLVGEYLTIAAFLCNLRSLFYDNQTSSYFDCNQLSLDEYLALIDYINKIIGLQIKA